MYYFCTAISNRKLQLSQCGLFGAARAEAKFYFDYAESRQEAAGMKKSQSGLLGTARAMPSSLEHCRVVTRSRKILGQNFAEIAQLVEHDLAKVGVASSSLVFRSNK